MIWYYDFCGSELTFTNPGHTLFIAGLGTASICDKCMKSLDDEIEEDNKWRHKKYEDTKEEHTI